MDRKERFPLPLFLVLLFVISWIGAAPMVLASHGMDLPPAVKALQFLMLFGPAITACAGAWINNRWTGVKELLRGLLLWRVHIGWYFLAFVIPPVVYFVALIFSNLAGQTNIAFPAAQKFFSTFFITLGIYLILNTEEIAWRGYVLPRIQSRFDVVPAAVVIGLIWTLFHLPLFWIKGGHPAGYPFWLFTLMVLSITFLFSATYNGTAGSILIVHLLHQTLNAAVEAIPVYPKITQSIFPICISTGLFLLIAAVLLFRNQEST